MKLYQILYFQQVCKNGFNLTKAAESLHVSQPSVSNAIKDLENKFGIALFNRINNRLVITKEGEYFLNRIEGLIEQINEIEQEMKLLASSEYPLRIGIPLMEFPGVYALIYDQFANQFPKIKIELVETGDMLGLINEDLIDVAILATNGIDLKLLKLFNSHLINLTQLKLFVNCHHPLANETNISKEDLRDLPMVLLDHVKLREFLFHNDMHPNIIANTNQLSTMLQMVKTNKASTLLFGDLNTSKEIRNIPIEGIPSIRIEMVWKKNKISNISLKQFIAYMIENSKV